MAFSESFGLGDSTFLNIETKANEAHQGKTKKSKNNSSAPKRTSNLNPLDVIDESPTSLKEKTIKSRSRNNISQFGEKRRRKFQKSKSESTLEKSGIRSHAVESGFGSKDDGFSEFFKSDFSIERKEKLKSCISASEIESAVKCINSDGYKDDLEVPDVCFGDSNIFSEMIGEIKSQNEKDSQILEMPIFSGDLQDILSDNSLTAGSQNHNIPIESDNAWGESLDLSEFKEKSLCGIVNANDSQEDSEPPEEVVHIDDATFICISECDEKSFREDVNNAKAEVKSILGDEQIKDCIVANKSSKVSARHESHLNASLKSVNKSTLKQAAPYDIKPDLEELKKMCAWNLPASVLKEYGKKGILKMFDWQVECLSNPKVLFEHCNLVYSAPTSAGKTLVSEILLIKTILERAKKVILILPFISVVREKMFYLQDLLTPSGYRVEGFFGGYTPPGGFENINVAICTIEKANSIINKLLEQGKLEDIGTVVVDEIHLISDPGRGYILELLLAKIMYMSRKYGLQIQIITMSATLANVELLKKWLDAELYITQYRPVALQEMIKIGTKIFDRNLELVREINTSDFGDISDQDHVAQLCIETIADGCSVLVFCPSKDWCENLSTQLAGAINTIGRSGSEVGNKLRANIKRDAIEEVKKQLRDIPTGLDSVLEKTINYACAFHHAGLTTEERDIIETCFKSGALKVIVATSTLSSGVNLPARRVIIRSPLFGGKQMSSLTYKQMIGRAGRTGKDTLGESILICTDNHARVGKDLVSAALNPISSCLEMESSTHLKRALLEVISSGVATTKGDIDNFINCTLLKTQKEIASAEKEDEREEEDDANQSFILDSLEFLIDHEFIRLQRDDEKSEDNYVATRLGMACLASSMPPTDGLILFSELQKSRRCFVLESELHAVYLVTPYSVCYQLQGLDWLLYLDLWEKLSPAMKKVGELVGVKESFLVRAMRGQTKLDYKLLQIHKRFYTALALQELVNETPVNTVAVKYKCTRGLLQSLQQMASTFAGIVTAFCNSLKWSTLSLIVGQFKERLFFGVHRDLIDLMRLPNLNYKRARVLFDAGIENLIDLANADVFTIEKILHNSLSFDTTKKLENEDEYEKNQRNIMRNLFITGKAGLTVQEAAKILVDDARMYVRFEIGGGNIDWSQNRDKDEESKEESSLQMSSDKNGSKRKSKAESVDVSPPKVERKEHDEQAANEVKVHMTINKPRSPVKLDRIEIGAWNGKESGTPVSTKCMSTKHDNGSENIITRSNEKINSHSLNTNVCKEPRPKAPKTAKKAETKSKSNQRDKSATQQKDKVDKSSPKPRFSNKENYSPRRSPRNHTSSSHKCDKILSDGNDLFMNESSFEINSAIANGMDQKHVAAKSPMFNKSSDEIAASQEMTFQPRTQSTRLLRSCKEHTRSNHSSPMKQSFAPESNTPPDQSNSIEVSDDSFGISLLQNPIQLNSSHILSTSKTEPDALSLDCINIIDICGSQILFKNAMKEILNVDALGFSIGLEKHSCKLKPLIGANLLINQVATKESSSEKKVNFNVDDSSYISGIAMVISENVSFFLNLQAENTCVGITKEMKIETLLRLLDNPELTLQIYDSKEQLKVLKKAIPDIKAIRCKLEDPKVANWLLQPDKAMHFVSMARQFAPECKALVELSGSGRGFGSIGLDSNCAIFGRIRSSIEACATIHILKGQIENLKRIGNGQLHKFFIDLEMPLQLSLYNMETCGFPANEVALRQLFQLMMDTMKRLETKIYEAHGSRFSLGSSSAVAKVLGLHRKTNGRVSTSKQILEKVDTPIAQMIISYRKLSVTLSKNIQPLLRCIVDDRIRGQSITFTSTGRISMQEPNLQNVAKDFDVTLGSEKVLISCRSSFFPSDERCLISADFCQLEMRILAHLSQDPSLVKAMNSEKDVFTAIASKWNRVAEESVSEQLRNGTKQICYAIVYGMGMQSLASSLKCTEQEAKTVSEQFHAAYSGIRLYADKVVRFARQHGYIETITGRRRYLDNINSGEMQLRSQAERQAVNSAIQGSAADIAKSAILRMEKNLAKYREKMGLTENCANLVLHLHDELIFEVPENKAKKVAKVLSITMENCVRLSVPLRVKLKIGKSWGGLQEVKL